MNENYYSSYFFDFFISFCGVTAVFVFFRYLKYPKFVLSYGRNTLFYYAFHIPMCSILVKLIQINSRAELSGEYLRAHPLIYTLITLVTLIILSPLCSLTNRYIPWLVGGQKKKEKKS